VTSRNVILIGFSGSGKSTVASLLAARLGYERLDTDAMVAASAGRSVHEIFQRDGETAFRAMESRAVEQAAAGNARVIACGGGAILALRNYTVLRDAGTIVYLRTSPGEILARLGDAPDRPLLRGKAGRAVPALLAERSPAYQSAADLIVDTDGKSAGEVADEIHRLLKERP